VKSLAELYNRRLDHTLLRHLVTDLYTCPLISVIYLAPHSGCELFNTYVFSSTR
jgi:hypothetical protein